MKIGDCRKVENFPEQVSARKRSQIPGICDSKTQFFLQFPSQATFQVLLIFNETTGKSQHAFLRLVCPSRDDYLVVTFDNANNGGKQSCGSKRSRKMDR